MNRPPWSPRLPHLPAPPYDPPLDPTPPVSPLPYDGQGTDYESVVVPVAMPTNTTVKVWSSSRRWSAIDVSLSSKVAGFSATQGVNIGIQVWAIMGSQRVLVQTGRFSNLEWQTRRPVHVVSYRGCAERWEVTLSFNFAPTTNADIVEVGIVCSDAPAISVPESIGAMSMNSFTGRLSTGQGLSMVAVEGDALQLVAIEGINASAANRFLNVHDLVSVAASVGAIPVISIRLPLNNALASPNPLHHLGVLSARRWWPLITVVMSTTANVTTLPGAVDSFFNAWVK